MRKLLALLLAALLLAPSLAKAQDATVIIPWTTSAPSYTGVGDIQAFTAYYGLRAYSAAIVTAGTQALVNVRQNSNSHTCDIIVSGTGGLGLTANCSTGGDNGQSASSFCGTTCFVTEAYDQTGNGHNLTQATTADQPTLVFNCNRLRALHGLKQQRHYGLPSAGNFTPATGVVSFEGVALRSAATGSQVTLIVREEWHSRLKGSNPVATTSGQVELFVNASSISAAASNAAFHSMSAAVVNGASSIINVDGTEGGSSLHRRTPPRGPSGSSAATQTATTKRLERRGSLIT